MTDLVDDSGADAESDGLLEGKNNIVSCGTNTHTHTHTHTHAHTRARQGQP